MTRPHPHIRQMTRTESIRRALLFALTAIALLVGLLRDETRLVLQRAIQICLGCIGIG
ncbi:MAG: CD1871A family CXXC motif-containing protein [Eubacteriales bacterium]|nr:CD1871A family CXXC motif-containing protein [Eubacteriales bacterium]